MQPCSVEIQYYRPEREFRTGEPVQGWVRVTVHRKITCRGLHVNGFWRAKSIGHPSSDQDNTTQKNYFQQILFQGAWEQGQRYEYPFEFKPPLNPLSYEGELISVQHGLSARADVTWAQPPTCYEPFELLVGSEVESTDEKQRSAAHHQFPMRKMLAVTVAIISVLLAVTYSWAFLVVLILAAYIAGFSFGDQIARTIVRDFQWSTPNHCHPGETLETEVDFRTRFGAKPRNIGLTFEGQESVAVGGTGQRTTYRHSIEKVHQDSDVPKRTEANRYESFDSIAVPDSHAFTLRLLDHQIRWMLTLSIDLPFGLRHQTKRDVFLAPKPVPYLANREEHINPNPAFQSKTFFELLKIASKLSGVKDVDEARNVFDQDDLFSVVMKVSRSRPTQNRIENGDYSKGTTLLGHLEGSSLPVQLHLPNPDEAIYADHQDHQWTGTVVIAEYLTDARTLVLLAV